jgi:hypothetical protein
MAPRDENGKAGITNGKIVVINPQEGGRPAVLCPPEDGVEIFVNGKRVEEAVELREEDQIEVNSLVFTEEAQIQVKVSPDGLYASLAVSPQITTSFSLKEAEMTASLKPEVCKNEVREKVCTLAAAEAELRKNKVTFGLDFAALKEIVEKAEGQFQIVARGEKAQEGKDGFIEFLINPKIEKISYGEEKEWVDYRERYRFPTVQKGDRIALIHPPVDGIPGQSVTGKITLPRAVKSVKIKCGEGAALQENGKGILAFKDGRLVVSGNCIKVANLLVHNGDVDLESGNLRFNGNVQIYGNIRERMRVETRGDLYVDGNGYEASVKAGRGIHFTGNLIQCQVEGGLYFTFLQGTSLLLEKICVSYNSFLDCVKNSIRILRERKQSVDERAISFTTNLVLEKNLPVIRENITKLEQLLNKTKIQDQRIERLKEFLIFLGKLNVFSGRFKDFQELERVGNGLGSLLKEFQDVLEDIPVLSASYIQNSNLIHSGEINIVGAGCYQSTLQAGKGVRIQGIFRGGTIRAQGDVRVKEFACMIDAASHAEKKRMIGIKVPAGASIYFGKVHGDTVIQVGKPIYRFDREYEKIKVVYDCKKGMFQISNY